MRNKFVIAAILSLLVVALVLPAAAQAALRNADLGMARLNNIQVTTSGARKFLRFSATIVNVGVAPFELRGTRSSSSDPFSIVQRIRDDSGGFVDVPVTVGTQFAGDGHSHWHIVNLERYELSRLDNGNKVGTSAKSGFCFYDTTAYRTSLAGAPSSAQYGSSGCGTTNSLSLTMGISVGWGDTYPWTLPDQYIEITGLANGHYRLTATADAEGRFQESNESNNATWVDLSFSKQGKNTRVRILGYGPAA